MKFSVKKEYDDSYIIDIDDKFRIVNSLRSVELFGYSDIIEVLVNKYNARINSILECPTTYYATLIEPSWENIEDAKKACDWLESYNLSLKLTGKNFNELHCLIHKHGIVFCAKGDIV